MNVVYWENVRNVSLTNLACLSFFPFLFLFSLFFFFWRRNICFYVLFGNSFSIYVFPNCLCLFNPYLIFLLCVSINYFGVFTFCLTFFSSFKQHSISLFIYAFLNYPPPSNTDSSPLTKYITFLISSSLLPLSHPFPFQLFPPLSYTNTTRCFHRSRRYLCYHGNGYETLLALKLDADGQDVLPHQFIE